MAIFEGNTYLVITVTTSYSFKLKTFLFIFALKKTRVVKIIFRRVLKVIEWWYNDIMGDDEEIASDVIPLYLSGIIFI